MYDRRKRAALFVSTLASFLMPFMGSSVPVAIPAIGRDLHMDAVLLSWIPSSYLLAAGMFLVPCGRLGDLYGRKRVFLVGMSIYTLGSLLLAANPWAGVMIPLRALQGVGGAMLFGTGIAIITSVFPHGERGRALGINTAAVYLGLSLGPTAGGFLTQHLGWRSIFSLNVPLGLFIIWVVVKYLRDEWAEARGESFHALGAVLFALCLPALLVGFTWLPARDGFLLMGAGLLLGGLFVASQLRAIHPVLDVRDFLSNRVFAMSNLAALIAYSSTATVDFLVSLHLQYAKGETPQNTGLALFALPVAMALVSPLSGRLSDRVEPRWLCSGGMALVAVGLMLFSTLSLTTPLWAITLCLFCVGVGFGLFSSPNTNAVMSSVERRSFGVASGTLATMRVTGQLLALGIATLIFTHRIGHEEITAAQLPGLLSGIRLAFLFSSLLCLAAVLASLVRGRVHS